MSEQRSAIEQTQGPAGWYLEGCGSDGKSWLIHLRRFPFSVGRQEGCDLRLTSNEVSRRHAELYETDSGIGIREDGQPRNGTFVNRERLTAAQPLKHGDILRFGSFEFRVICKKPSHAPQGPARDPARDGETVAITRPELQLGPLGYANDFEEMLQQRAVIPYYQPLVRCDDRQLYGYELLGRCRFPGLPESPGLLFGIAHGLGKEVELSALFREVGVEHARTLAPGIELYFNTAPGETSLAFLQQALPRARELAPTLPLTMEVHEGAITNIAMMRRLRDLLAELDIRLAYDDFGAGQARLLELMDVPPDVLKFDIALIRDIHLRSRESLSILRTLVTMTRERGIMNLAEGVEVEEELEVCRDLGFDYIQGYLTGRPGPSFLEAANA